MPRAALLLCATILAGCHRVGGLRAEEGPPARAEDRTVRVRVASYNVWALPLGFAADLQERLAKMPAALRALDPDVVCLQEVWTPTAREALAKALPGHVSAENDRGGLMVLSRFPIRDERFVPYPVLPELSLVERLAGKGVLEVLLDTPAGPLRVVTTHMVAFDRGSREKGLPVLVEVVEARRDLPLVAAGDFNLRRLTDAADRLSPSYQRLVDAGCTDAAPPVCGEDGRYAELENTHVGWPRTKGDEGWWRPDHVLFRSGEAAELRLVACRMALDTPETALSDHNLMLAELALAPR